MKSSEALRQARKLIAQGDETFVCRALQRGAPGGIDTDVYQRLLHMFGNVSVVGWLWGNSLDFRLWYSSHQEYPDKVMRDYRLLWIDWMIPAYKAVGD